MRNWWREEEGFDRPWRRRMGGLEFLGAFVLPLLLLAASEFDWNLISFINLIAFFVVQFTKHRRGLHIWWRSWFLIIFSLSTIVAQLVFNIIWFIEGNEWTKTHAWWAKLIGLVRIQPWGPMPIVYFLILQLAIAFIAYVETQSTSIRYQCSSWRKFTSAVSHLGSHLKVASCLLLPAIQLVVGISHSSWIFLPFFICSCMSLVDWSLTSNFLCLFRSGVKHTNVLLRGSVYRHFSINFFTYGFPVLFLALSLWSFSFASICVFGLLAYVGYILYAFPSLFHLHHLNGLLLIFILLWAASTYVFNVAFTLLNKSKEVMEIWETIGLWHYPIPGLYLFSQFCLGALVAIGNLVNDSVFLHLSNEDGHLQKSSCGSYNSLGNAQVLPCDYIGSHFCPCDEAWIHSCCIHDMLSGAPVKPFS